MAGPDLLKDESRRALREARALLSDEDHKRMSDLAIRRFLASIPYKDYQRIALYWPIGAELNPLGLARSPELADHTFALPIIEAEESPLGFRRWAVGDEVVAADFGGSVPRSTEALVPDLVVVPLVGFDRQGHRLGQGGGFYDRTLAELRANSKILAVGLAFCVQECLNIPHEDHDELLDQVVTEQEAIEF